MLASAPRTTDGRSAPCRTKRWSRPRRPSPRTPSRTAVVAEALHEDAVEKAVEAEALYAAADELAAEAIVEEVVAEDLASDAVAEAEIAVAAWKPPTRTRHRADA